MFHASLQRLLEWKKKTKVSAWFVIFKASMVYKQDKANSSNIMQK